METLLGHKREFADCVARERNERPGSTGKLLMRWVIRPDGSTTDVVAAEEFVSAPIGLCMTTVIQTMKFPKHEVQGEPIVFPFKF